MNEAASQPLPRSDRAGGSHDDNDGGRPLITHLGFREMHAYIQKGRLLLKVIVVLVLFGVLSIIVFNKQLGRQRQEEEMPLAQKMKAMQDAEMTLAQNFEIVKYAVRLYVNDNMADLESGAITTPKSLTAIDLEDYLPSGASIDGFKIVVLKRGGAQPIQVVILRFTSKPPSSSRSTLKAGP